MFPTLEKFSMKVCLNIDLKMFDHLILNNIKELYFVNNGFINSDFETIVVDYLEYRDGSYYYKERGGQ